ncbi:MAG: leucine-rich repeat domain-containing protein [Planctomyces sp.]
MASRIDRVSEPADSGAYSQLESVRSAVRKISAPRIFRVLFLGLIATVVTTSSSAAQRSDGKGRPPASASAMPVVFEKKATKNSEALNSSGTQPKKTVSKDPQVQEFESRPSTSITDDDVKKLADHPPALEQIQTLNLKGAQVSGASLSLLSRFTSLEHLDLSGVAIDAKELSAISTAVQLKHLSLAGCSLRDEAFAAIAPLTELRVLNLSSTKITDAGFVHLHKLTKLEEIYVSGNPITGNGFQALGPKGAKAPLRIVHAGSSDFGLFGLFHLKNVNSIEELVAAGCKMSDQSLQGIRSMKKLRRLHIAGNDISDSGLKVLTGMKAMEDLDISNTINVSNETLKRLKTFRQLKTLNIESTSCNEAGVMALKKSLTGCTIRFNKREY